MPLIDERGRVFGRWNLIDALVVIGVILLLPVGYGAYRLFRTPTPDIATVEQSVEDLRTSGVANGVPAVLIMINRQPGANIIETVDRVRALLPQLEASIPGSMTLKVVVDRTPVIRASLHDVERTLAISVGLVILVVFLFLRNVRATLIPCVAVPVSLIGTFAGLTLLGYSINTLTLFGMVLAIGIVVDDAIVVLENIYRHIEAGMSPMDAAKKGMDEIAFAVIAITLSLIVVFLPLAFLKGATGRLFIEFAVAVCGSVAVSAFVALSLSPMLAARVLKPIKEGHQKIFFLRWFDAALGWFTRLYGAMLRGLVRATSFLLRPFVALGWFGRAVAFFVTLAALGALTWGLNVPLLGKLEGEFLPEEDKGRLLCFVFAPEGSTSEYTDRQVREMEDILKQVPEVQAFGAVIAFSMTGAPGQANSAIVFVRLKDRLERSRNVRDIVNGPGGLRMKFFNDVEGAIAVPNIPKAIGRGFGAPFQLVIQGQDLESLNGYVNELLGKLRSQPYLVNVRSSFEVTKPELRLDVDRNRAAALGVSIEDVSRTLQILFGGLDLSRVKLDGKQYQVITQLQRMSRLTPQDLDRLYVRNRDGQLIQLSSIVRREAGSSPNVVEHFNRIRSATISASLNGVPLGTAIDRVEALVKADLPPGFLYDWTGESKEFKDAWKEFLVVLVLALIITYMVLAAQFESFLHPLTVLLSIPLGGVGALGLLWLVDYLGKTGVIKEVPAMNINLFSLIGFVLLVGLVTKNAILLVEFANQQTEKGADPRDAIVEAGKVRLRPILMTALSTIAGIIPIAIGFGAGAESRRPMGVCVIGGMLSSTFLTLFVIPVVYTAFSAVAGKFAQPTPATTPSPAPPAEVIPAK